MYEKFQETGLANMKDVRILETKETKEQESSAFAFTETSIFMALQGIKKFRLDIFGMKLYQKYRR